MYLNKKDKPEKQEEAAPDEKEEQTTIMIPAPEIDARSIGLCGDVDEEKTAEIIGGFMALRQSGLTLVNPDSLSTEPIEFIVSTSGGSAHDMFAIYDTMRLIKSTSEIHTVGLGKVMSAGVLLLAAGTKGCRTIGKNCRVMLHGVTGGHIGSIHNLENEMDEIRWLQERYIAALVEETDMTKRLLKKLIERKVNVYLTAEEAVEYGIADEII
tara:strand:+ start:1143 stop:1778 length:636 start_codon:yes stop_codon:yes gene_type:complete